MAVNFACRLSPPKKPGMRRSARIRQEGTSTVYRCTDEASLGTCQLRGEPRFPERRGEIPLVLRVV